MNDHKLWGFRITKTPQHFGYADVPGFVRQEGLAVGEDPSSARGG